MIDAELRACITETTRRLKQDVAGVRWVGTENLHLTMRFLGQSSPVALEALGGPLRSAAAACPRCEAPVSALGMFPERGSPRVLWLAMELPGAVLRLQEACEAAAVAAGFEPERRPFRSHLTLGRFREQAPRPALPSLDLGPARLDTLVLFQSTLQRAGAVYTPLQEFPLGGT
jgi:2'-5' RNA ligase